MSLEDAAHEAIRFLESFLEGEPFDISDTKKLLNSIKAALTQQEKPEPFCFTKGYYGGYCVVEPFDKSLVITENLALYTKPPRREWVGLTEDEIDNLWVQWHYAVCLDHKTWAGAIETKLKELNT